jgi:hypothetical protein
MPNLSNQFRVSGARTDHHEYRDEYRIKRPPEGNCERDQRDRSNLKTECALSSPALTQNQNAVLIAMSFFRPDGTSIPKSEIPALKRWAIFGNIAPDGAARRPDQSSALFASSAVVLLFHGGRRAREETAVWKAPLLDGCQRGLALPDSQLSTLNFPAVRSGAGVGSGAVGFGGLAEGAVFLGQMAPGKAEVR